MEILRSIRFEVDHAIVTYRGSVHSSTPISVETDRIPILREKQAEKEKSQERKNQHQGELSKVAYRRLKRAVSWLERISDEKAGNVPWKCVFVTLTVPEFGAGLSEGPLKKILNVFLTWLRRSQGVKSYVWKAELTKKGKLHYHILTDVNVDPMLCRSHWNKLLSDNGFLDRYIEKFGSMSRFDYLRYREKNEGKVSSEYERGKREAAYNYGLLSGWSDPRSVQVDLIPVTDSIVNYLGKYLGKSASGENGEKLTGRIWGCSQNLSDKNVLRISVDPMTKEVELLRDVLDLATGCEDIVIEVKGVSKTIGYKIHYSSDIWLCDNSGRRLNQVLHSYFRLMKEGELRHNYQEKVSARSMKRVLEGLSVVDGEKVQEKKEKGGSQLQMFGRYL